MHGMDGTTGDVLVVVTDDILADGPPYSYRLEFGSDDGGPWGTLCCSQPGCDRHQAVRPLWNDGDGTATTDADIFGALLDFAETDGWELNRGAWCTRHRDRPSA